MSRYLKIFGIALFSVFLIACNDNSSDDNNNNTDNEIIPKDDTVVAAQKIIIDGEDSVWTVELSRLPHSYARFLELRQDIAYTPAGGAVMFIVALRIYQMYPKEGTKCLVNCVHPNWLYDISGDDSYNGKGLSKSDMSLIKSQLAANPRLPYAYMKGAAPENGYMPDSIPYTFEFTTNPYSYGSDESLKLYAKTKGADSDRPIKLKEDIDGIWKAYEWSSLLSGIKK